jgi:transposase
MIILQLAEGFTYSQIAEKLGVDNKTISLWKKRFEAHRVAGLTDSPRTGRPKLLTEKEISRILTLVMEKVPPGKTHWSTYDLSRKTGVSQTSVSQILRRNKVKPHLTGSFMVSNDPDFETKATKIIGLYLKPPKNAVVLCVDEKSQIQALDRLQPNLPLKPHLIERHTFEYKRNGTASLFAAFNIKTGSVSGMCSETHNRYDFLNFLEVLKKEYSQKNQTIHVILDNFRTHKTKEVEKWLKENKNWKFHFTPTYSSWINQVESWFSIISRQCIRRGVFHSTKQLVSKIMIFIKEYNKTAKPFVWTYDNPNRKIS